MKRTLYYIDNVDNPTCLWIIIPGKTKVRCGGFFTGTFEGTTPCDYIRDDSNMKAIPKREAKSLFPGAFKVE